MLHHLFKNAAPGSNAAIWRGLFYKEWLHRKPTRWVTLVIGLTFAAFVPLSLPFVIMTASSVHAPQRAWDAYCTELEGSLPVSRCKRLITLLICRSGPYLLIVLWMGFSQDFFVYACHDLGLKHEPALWRSMRPEVLCAAGLLILASMLDSLLDGLDFENVKRHTGAKAFGVFILVFALVIFALPPLGDNIELLLAFSSAFAAHTLFSLAGLRKYLKGEIRSLVSRKTDVSTKQEETRVTDHPRKEFLALKMLWFKWVSSCFPRNPLWRGLLMREHFRCGGKALVAWILLLCLAFQNHHPVLSFFVGILYFPLVAGEYQTMETLEAELSRPYKLWQQYAAAMLYHAIPLFLIGSIHCGYHHQALISPFVALFCVSLIPLHRLHFVERHTWISYGFALALVFGIFLFVFNGSMELRPQPWPYLFFATMATAFVSFGLICAAKADLDIREEEA